MAYDSVVCIKQVPDTKRITGDAMRSDGTVNRAALPAIFNPEDRNALEAALALRDIHGGSVTAITMGPPAACDILREALMRGVDHAILLTDRRAAASDTLATSYILACAIARLKPDMVFCGRQAIDGDTAQVGPQLAEKLGCTLVTYLEKIELANTTATVTRNVGNGTELVAARLPALFTVMESANRLRPPAARRIMRYKRARSSAEVSQQIDRTLPGSTPEERLEATRQATALLAKEGLLIEQLGLDDIGAAPDACGLPGSPTRVHRIQSIVLAGGNYREFSADISGVQALVAELIEEHTIG